jgi:hypothetical protein
MSSTSPNALKLSFFPIDPLSQITDWLDGISIGRMWFCGDHKLQSIMALGGVRRLDIVFRIRKTKIVFPRLTRCFDGLLHLSLSVNKSVILKRPITLDWQYIPPSLHYLRLDCAIELRSFGTTPTGRFVYRNVAQLLPNLQTLSISYMTLYPEFAKVLPPIRSFIISNGNTFNEDFCALLPTSITELDVGSHPMSSFSELDDPEHPPPMKHFLSPEILRWGRSWLELHTIPSSVTSLSLGNWWVFEDKKPFESQTWHSLPKNLLHLSADVSAAQLDSNFDMKPIIAQLPRTLTHLKLKRMTWDAIAWDVKWTPFLPSNLKVLQLVGWNVLPEDFKVLPRTLEQFSCTGSHGFVSYNCQFLPPNITSLKITEAILEFNELGLGITTRKTVETSSHQLQIFPPHLTFLFVKVMHYQFIPHLPKSLTTLKTDFNSIITHTTNPQTEIFAFHPSIQLLDLVCTVSEPLPCLQAIPSTLTSLTINLQRSFGTFEEIVGKATSHPPIHVPIGWSSFFPRTLSSLVVTAPISCYTDEWMMQLPPHLKKLVWNFENDFSSHLAITGLWQLPSSIVNLSIRTPLVLHFDVWNGLPKSLESLSISAPESSIPFDRKTFDLLPPNLGALKLPWHSIDASEKFTNFAEENLQICLSWDQMKRRLRRMIS